MFTTLVSAESLRAHQNHPNWVFIDCRAHLFDLEYGEKAYHAGHLPHAYLAHLEHDLSGEMIKGKTGRHPLPEVPDFLATLAAWGIQPATQVVAYDDMGGLFAARLWWMLKWLGHEAVAVLDGGLAAYQAVGGALITEIPAFKNVPLPTYSPQSTWVLSADEVLPFMEAGGKVWDVRTADRFRGENEIIDPVAGHIPHAQNFPFTGVWTADKHFLPVETLQKALSEKIMGHKVACYCGSGVTAAFFALAMVHAGLPMPKLYAGSWSDWITEPQRPIAIGG